MGGGIRVTGGALTAEVKSREREESAMQLRSL